MDTVDESELSEHTVSVLQRVSRGEQLLVTADGRPMARLTPVVTGQWRRWDDVADVFRSPVDNSWASDRERVPSGTRDPWAGT